MPVCEICGMEAIEVHGCSQCEAMFCDECGDVKRRLCYDCLGWEEEETSKSWSEVTDWEDGWNADQPH